ncbi:MAG: cytochrome c biogenesis protein CcsA [Pseudobdellovibrionaceae bacterium]|nr:MAG: cytochrome c biogenesis protein CcsA [Pseudobdellovibrionaceae bacterium]
MRSLISAITIFFVLFCGSWVQASVGEALKSLPVQDGGRLKPFDTFARESLELVFGKQKYKTPDGEKHDASEIVFTWMLVPEEWEKNPIVHIRHSGLREALQLENKRLHYSPQELMRNERVGLVIQELRTKQETREKLNPYFQAIQTLENQITMFHAVRLGKAMRVLPAKDGQNWLPVDELDGVWKERFGRITKAFVGAISARQHSENSEAVVAAEKELSDRVQEFMQAAADEFPDKYADSSLIHAETHYNHFHPFRWAWVAYLMGVIFMAFAMVSPKRRYYFAGWGFFVLGLLLHTYGFGLRSYIIGRPPVTNMYESVTWVAYGAVVFAMILEAIYRFRIVLLSSGVVAILCLILSDMAPAVLDGSMDPLEPVLRDNFWLTTHVLIITLSYAAFFLAFLLGDLLLVYYYIDESRFKDRIKQGVLAIYRSMQIGVVLLAAGTILGGIWADYSWGRFWGWDPKETWALIALLGYLAILHGRLIGWVRDFGLAVWSIVTFALVIMAWYGVNFVLGAGLHTYGFGAGGVEYVAAFVVAHILFVIFVSVTRNSRLKSKS